MPPLYPRAAFHCLPYGTSAYICPRPNHRRRVHVLDIIFIVLGFGGILAMAAYAALCGRI